MFNNTLLWLVWKYCLKWFKWFVMLKQLTKAHFFTRAAEYLGASNITEKMSYQQFLTAFWSVTCSIYFSNIDILAGGTSKFNFLIKESLSMKHDKPALNWTVKSLLLELFDWFLIILSLLISSVFTLLDIFINSSNCTFTEISILLLR